MDRALVGALAATQSLEQSDKTRSILLRELAHRVANNFAVVATLIRTKAASVSDPQAKLVLNEAIEQVTVMARLHRLLHADNEVPTIDSERFIAALCQDLETSMACARPISIQCVAVSRQLPVAQAVPMGLIVNELITNAIKHAFPDGRSGTVCVNLGEEDEHRLRLIVEDDGVGFRQPKSSGMGQCLVAALASSLAAVSKAKSQATAAHSASPSHMRTRHRPLFPRFQNKWLIDPTSLRYQRAPSKIRPFPSFTPAH